MFIAGILVSCGNDLQTIKEFAVNENDPVEVSDSVTIRISDNGNIRYVLTSPLVEKFKKEGAEDYEFPQGFKLEVFDTTGILQNTVSSKEADLNQKEGIVVLKDSVHLINIKKEQLRTDYLEIYFEKDSLFTGEPVTVSSLSGTINGKNGLTSNLNFTKYKLLKIRGDIATNSLENEQTSEPR